MLLSIIPSRRNPQLGAYPYLIEWFQCSIFSVLGQSHALRYEQTQVLGHFSTYFYRSMDHWIWIIYIHSNTLPKIVDFER